MMEYMHNAIKVPCPFSFCSQHYLVTEACLFEPKRELRNLTYHLFLISLWTTRNYGQRGFVLIWFIIVIEVGSQVGFKLIVQRG